MSKKRVLKAKKKIGQIPGSIIYTGNKSKEKLSLEAFDYTKETCSELDLKSIVFSQPCMNHPTNKSGLVVLLMKCGE